MADPRFFRRAGPFALGHLAEIGEARLAAPDEADKTIVDVAALESAGPAEITFLDNRKYLRAFSASQAGAAFVRERDAGRAPTGMALLVTADPYKAFARAAQAFYPQPQLEPGQSSSALIDPTAILGAGCEIGPYVVIEASVKIGIDCRIGAHTVIAAGVEIGDACRIGPQVTLSHCLIGSRVVLHPGVRIGQAGFGFAPDANGPVKVPQLGRVIIGNDVDIGANTTIDRGSGHDTVIGPGSMVDNLVQIGHNVVLGRGCVLAGQVGVSGSTKLGDFVMAGGQAGFAGHLNIGDGARVGAQAGMMRDIPAGETVLGSPALPIKEFMRQVATLERLAKKKDER